MAPRTFSEITVQTPTAVAVETDYRRIEQAFARATSPTERQTAVEEWDKLRRELETWESLVNLRFQQDTRNPEYKAAREYCDGLRPKLTELAVNWKRHLLASPHRAELEKALGAHAFRLWEVDVLTFDPAIASDLVTESQLEASYTELLAGAKLAFRGESYNHSEILKFREHADRQTRHDAEQVRWTWFEEQAARLDAIYADLVQVRHTMARKLHFDQFIELGYRRMKRIDYTQADVEQFRAEVRDHLVPLAVRLRQQQAATLGVSPLQFWDEAVFDSSGNPRPLGDHDWLIARAREMFDTMCPELGSFFRLMVSADLMDLKNREGKAGGGFCTGFPSIGWPYIFANFNGTKGDVEVFTHEMGHAFQCYESRQQPLTDYLWPTFESCEIHSMGLEFLTWPWMEQFFGADAERFRRVHLTQALLFIPYGVAVDHFQHLVYANPQATAAERHAMWQEMERLYLPWRNYGDLPHVRRGGFWQFQRHIYLSPFYYIDYTLAETCALQLWARSRRNREQTMQDYLTLCRRGGEAPFQELVRSAGLVSPFQPGCLSQALAEAAQALGISS